MELKKNIGPYSCGGLGAHGPSPSNVFLTFPKQMTEKMAVEVNGIEDTAAHSISSKDKLLYLFWIVQLSTINCSRYMQYSRVE